MQDQDEIEDKKEKLPTVNDSKYKKMTETLLSNESEIHNLSYTNLVHLSDYLKAYQSTLIKQNQFQLAKKIGDLKEKVLNELQSQTKQLKQYNKKDKSMAKGTIEFDEETEKLERELLQKQAQEQKNFDEEWDNDFNSPEYIKAKAQLDEKFQREIEDFHLSRKQQQNKIQMFKNQIRQQNENMRRSNRSTRPKSSSTGIRRSNCRSSYSKNSRPLTANSKPQTRKSTSSIKNRYQANSSSSKNNYSIFFPLYIWIGNKKKNNKNSNTNNNSINDNCELNNNDQNNLDNSNMNDDDNKNDLQTNHDQRTENDTNNEGGSTDQANELSSIIDNSTSTLVDKNDEENDDLNSTMGSQLLMLAERQSSGDEDEDEDENGISTEQVSQESEAK